jgi:hypothetical protein
METRLSLIRAVTGTLLFGAATILRAAVGNLVPTPSVTTNQPEQFIVLNLSGGVSAAALAQIRREFTDAPDVRGRVGVAAIFSYFAQPCAAVAADLREFLRLSQEYGLPVVVQLDGENWWGGRPDLWNWWNPGAPGYSPANRANVEPEKLS